MNCFHISKMFHNGEISLVVPVCLQRRLYHQYFKKSFWNTIEVKIISFSSRTSSNLKVSGRLNMDIYAVTFLSMWVRNKLSNISFEVRQHAHSGHCLQLSFFKKAGNNAHTSLHLRLSVAFIPRATTIVKLNLKWRHSSKQRQKIYRGE